MDSVYFNMTVTIISLFPAIKDTIVHNEVYFSSTVNTKRY